MDIRAKNMREPDFERLRKTVLLLGEPDMVPNAELWIDRKLESAILGRPIKSVEDEVEFWRVAGYDYAHIVPIYEFPKKRQSLGDISWVSSTKGVITNKKEFNEYRWPENIDFTSLDRAARALRGKQKLISGSLCGIFEETSFIMGFETLCLCLLEDRDLVRMVVDKVGSFILNLVGKVSEYNEVGAIWLSDDIAYKGGTLISPKDLRELIFPWYKRIGGVAKRHNLPFIYHSDGRLWSVLDDLIDCGVNAIQPIEPLSMDAAQLKKSYGDRLCLIGNIDLDYPLTRGTPKEVKEMVKERIEKLAPGGGYCCGSSNTIASYVPVENYIALLEATDEYGRYPIR
jgi:uroporphyrinogen decarboxylase